MFEGQEATVARIDRMRRMMRSVERDQIMLMAVLSKGDLQGAKEPGTESRPRTLLRVLFISAVMFFIARLFQPKH